MPKQLFQPRHGMRRTRTYNIWCHMKRRCACQRDESYPRYGGRGITVCDRWAQFENFLADMGEAPPDLSLDRINNDGNYEPGNCRWASREEQNANRRDNRVLVAFGEARTLSAWAGAFGLRRDTLHRRLADDKMTIEEALTRPIQSKRRA